MYTGSFKVFEDIIEEIIMVYTHDQRPWLIGYSGGKDSTLLVSLVYEAITRIPFEQRIKKVYIITSDTMVENPIVESFMHSSSKAINEHSKLDKLNIEAHIIYPEFHQTFWSLVIGLGYPTPEPPGFRWCTDRLKINPMNKFVEEKIKENGEVIILLGVRKAESLARKNSITAREIEGKLLNMHNNIERAYVYNPLTEINNDLVWEFLLKGDQKSPWGSDLKHLFNLYQGENLGEEQSVIGEIDKRKIPITGNSRFGCWCCTIVKEDKSLQNFINKGSVELIPLRDFRNWLVSIRQDSTYRESKRRDGSIYQKSNGNIGFGPFNFEARKDILRRLLQLEVDTNFNLITIDELKEIDFIWDSECDLTRRCLVDIYYEVKGKKLPWDDYKKPVFQTNVLNEINEIAEQYDLPSELIIKLIASVDKNKNITQNNKLQKEFDKIINQEWLHYDAIKEGLGHED